MQGCATDPRGPGLPTPAVKPNVENVETFWGEKATTQKHLEKAIYIYTTFTFSQPQFKINTDV